MMAVGIVMLVIGYAGVYTGWANLAFGFRGPKLSESLGIKSGILQPAPQGLTPGRGRG